ncbi:MAG TPA: hypothetical protein VLQ48_02810 [Chloroflexia bacterium]|nr:hypothetical protein [Chloroflexia bacterium]
MLGRVPRVPHGVMRWLIIGLMVLNGIQLVLLQATINSTLSLEFDQTWLYVGISFVCLLIAAGVIAFAFVKSRGTTPPPDKP